jgi:hypothetical protein
MADIEKALRREQFKSQIFPSLLLVVEELPNWEARATALNAAGLTTFHDKPWTRQNVHKLFHSYWAENQGHYSWNLHNQKLERVAAAVA